MTFSEKDSTTRHICLNCGCKNFITSAAVVQDWIVDENGNFIAIHETLNTIIAKPDDDNIWTCRDCGEEAILQRIYYIEMNVPNKNEINQNIAGHAYYKTADTIEETICKLTNPITHQTIRLTVTKDAAHQKRIICANIGLYYKESLLEYYESLPQIPSRWTFTTASDNTCYDITITNDAIS